MTKPTKGPPKVQLTAYVRADLKDRLKATATVKKQPERAVLEDVLDKGLPPSAEEPAPKAS